MTESDDFDKAVDEIAQSDGSLEKEDFITKQLIGNLKKKFQQAGRAGQHTVNAMQDLAYATRWSQEAERLYWDMKSGKPRTDADYEKAKKLLENSLHVLDTTLEHFPTAYSSIHALKMKLFVQLKDIEWQQKGVIKTPEELKAEVDADIQRAAAELKEIKDANTSNA